jgi:hypothetical protein
VADELTIPVVGDWSGFDQSAASNLNKVETAAKRTGGATSKAATEAQKLSAALKATGFGGVAEKANALGLAFGGPAGIAAGALLAAGAIYKATAAAVGLLESADKLLDARQEIISAGLLVDDSEVEAIRAGGDAAEVFRATLDQLYLSISADLAPTLTQFTTDLSGVVLALDRLVDGVRFFIDLKQEFQDFGKTIGLLTFNPILYSVIDATQGAEKFDAKLWQINETMRRIRDEKMAKTVADEVIAEAERIADADERIGREARQRAADAAAKAKRAAAEEQAEEDAAIRHSTEMRDEVLARVVAEQERRQTMRRAAYKERQAAEDAAA